MTFSAIFAIFAISAVNYYKFLWENFTIFQ